MQDRPDPKLHPTRRDALRVLAGIGGAGGLGWPRLQAAPVVGAKEVRVIVGTESAASRQMIQALKARYPTLLVEADPQAFDTRRGPAMHVSIGPQALRRALLADLKGPLVSVLTSSQIFRQTVTPDGHERTAVTALHSEASPLAQCQLMAALFERRISVGVLLSDASAYLEKSLRQAAAQTGMELWIERATPPSEVVRALTRLSGVQALLAVPDPTLYTPETLRSVLESTYRRGLPVIGFSAATVAAGTLGTAHATVDDVVADLTDLIDAWSPGASVSLPEARYPRYWRVSINDNVARSLGVSVSDKVLALGNPAPGRAP